MASLSDIRTRVRVRLEESVAAHWSDGDLDECIAGALSAYNAWCRLEKETTAAVADGARTTALPAGALSVRRVYLADETVVPQRANAPGWAPGEEQAWEQWSGLLRFTQPLSAQTLVIWYRAAHLATEVPAEHVDIIVAGATHRALELWAIERRKREMPTDMRIVTGARMEHDRLTNLARSSARMGGGG